MVIPTRNSMLLLLYKKQLHHQKSYSWMSQDYIQKQLHKFYGINITISGIKWQLANIERLGLVQYFKNKCGRRADGTIYRRPSNRMITVQGLLYLKATGLKLSTWLWDHVTRKVKLPRGKGITDYEKKHPPGRAELEAPNGVLKLLSKVGKSFTNLKLFT